MDEDTRQTLNRGRRVREILKQPQYQPLPVPEQIAVLITVNEGVLDDVPIEEIGGCEELIRHAIKEDQADLYGKIAEGDKLDHHDIDANRQAASAKCRKKEWKVCGIKEVMQ